MASSSCRAARSRSRSRSTRSTRNRVTDTVSAGERSDALARLQKDPEAFRKFREALREDREIVLAAVQEMGRALEYAGAAMKADPGVVLAAARNHGLALEFASEELKNGGDWADIVLAAVQQNGYALRFVGVPLNTDRNIVLAAVQSQWWVFRSLRFQLDPQKADDRAIILAAVRQNVEVVRDVGIPMADREMVLAAVQENGNALGIVDAPFRADPEIVLAAVTQHGAALRYADAPLLSNPKIVLAAACSGEYVVWHMRKAGSSLMRDQDLFLELIKAKGWGALKYADESLLGDKGFMLEAVRLPPKYAVFGRDCALEFAATSLQSDRDIVLPAVLADPSALIYADPVLREEILLGAGMTELAAYWRVHAEGPGPVYFRVNPEFTSRQPQFQRFVHALVHPVVLQVNSAQRHPNSESESIRVGLATLGGTAMTFDVNENTTAALRGPLAKVYGNGGMHPAAFNFVLRSGQKCKYDSDAPLV